MNPGGLVLVAIGGLALCQIFGGNALKRLRILPSNAGTAPTPAQPGPYGQLVGPNGQPTYPVGPPDAPNYPTPQLTPAARTLAG